ncbi:hypothetical protein M413DRAFT_32898 [Hebeloma cylindrosporum]|uniref:MYND-type domain-containing protein n=1 Tax=Hebeloma cylindrosporum TaxID=76867 RepID=A0A0C3BDR5_HEBCY|nr:hypothetical protein M413DRAFT_32898 [Hebeloma cylindrosporum h7]
MSLARPRKNYFFTSFLSATPEYNYCGTCLLGVFERKNPFPGSLKKAQFISDFQKDGMLLNLVMRFLFTVRTDKEIEEIFDRMEPCSCPMEDQEIHSYHQLGNVVEKEIFPMLTGAENATPAICLMSNLLRLVSVALDNAHVRTVAKGKSTIWPTSPKDLIPFGAENLVQRLLQWSRLIPDAMIFRFAGQCITFCGALVLPSFLAAKFTRHVVQAGRNLADHAWRAVQKPNPQTRRQIGISFRRQSSCIASFLDSTLDDQTIQTSTDFIDGVEIKSIQLLSIFNYLVTDDRLPLEGGSESIKAFLLNFDLRVLKLYSLVRGNFDRVPDIYLFPTTYEVIEPQLAADRLKMAELADSKEGEEFSSDGEDIEPTRPGQSAKSRKGKARILDSFTLDGSEGSLPSTMTEEQEAQFFQETVNNAMTFLRVAKFQLRCSVFACPNSIQSTGRKFQRCTKCRLALYCGKECQLKAWKDKEHPHSKTCQVVSKLVRIGRGEDLLFYCEHPGDPRWFPEELRLKVRDCWLKGGVSADELLCIILWGARLTSSGELPKMEKPEPGWDDYQAFIGELAGSSADRQPIPLIHVPYL